MKSHGVVFGTGRPVRAPDLEAASGGTDAGSAKSGTPRSKIFYFGCVMAIGMLVATVGIILTKFKIVLFG